MMRLSMTCSDIGMWTALFVIVSFAGTASCFVPVGILPESNRHLRYMWGLQLQSTSQTGVSSEPNVDLLRQESSSGVSYASVESGLDVLFPPEDIGDRNFISRKDGYWSFVYKGEEPDKALVYGEFEVGFFAQLLDRAAHHFSDSNMDNNWDDRVFCDLGSGAGRLVIGAAALHPGWKLCRGIELLPGIHEVAEERVLNCERTRDTGSKERVLEVPGEENLVMAPIHLSCGSFDDPTQFIGDVDCAFAFSTCMTPPVMEMISRMVGRQCRPGTLVITTEYMLPLEGPREDDEQSTIGNYQLELVEKIDGKNDAVGGTSTAFIHRLL